MSLSFAHMADIHIGNYPGKVEKGGFNSRFLDFVKTYHQSIDRIIADKMDFCIMAGDIFKTKTPSPDELDAFAEGIVKLIDNNIPIVAILGNHDVFMSEKKTHSFSAVYRTLELIKKSKAIVYDSFILSTKPEIVTLDVRGQKIQIQTMPYPVRSALKMATIQEVEKYMVDQINAIYETRDKSLPIVFTGHFSIKDASIGGEQFNFDKFAEPVISKSIFEGKDYLYVAMGHLHKYQVVSPKPLLIYCGSNNRVDFNEANEDKGFVEVKIEEKVRHRFVKVDARKFIDIKYDLSEERNPYDKLISLLTPQIDNIKDAVVRVTITISSKDIDTYDEDKISDFLNKYCYHIHGTTIPIIKRDKEVKDISGFKESMDVFEALKHYAEVKKIENKDQFLKLAEDIVKKARGGNHNAMS